MKGVIIGLILIISILFTGCGNNYQTYTKEDLYSCQAGRYLPSEPILEEAERQGWNINYLEIKNWTELEKYTHCSLEMVLNERIMVNGIETQVVPLYNNCNMQGMQNRLQAGVGLSTDECDKEIVY